MSKRRVGVAALAALAACACLAGCRQAPLSPEDERSQFDRYDLVRDRAPVPYLRDEFGRQRPNLRGRLLGRDQ